MGTTLPEIKTKGWNALVKELGRSGATRFILLNEPGEGNYTKERREIFQGVRIEGIIEELKKSE